MNLPNGLGAYAYGARCRFYFKASNLANVTQCRFRILNAGTSSYPAAWPGTWAVASYDNRSDWFRTPTTYDPVSYTHLTLPTIYSV